MSTSWMSDKGLALTAVDGDTVCRCGHVLDKHLLETEDVTCIACDCDGFIAEARDG